MKRYTVFACATRKGPLSLGISLRARPPGGGWGEPCILHCGWPRYRRRGPDTLQPADGPVVLGYTMPLGKPSVCQDSGAGTVHPGFTPNISAQILLFFPLMLDLLELGSFNPLLSFESLTAL